METETQEKNTRNNSLPAVILAVWGLLLAAVFLSYRGEDAGMLGRLLTNSASGAIFGFSGFSESLFGVLIASLIVLSWFGLGSAIVLAIRRISRHKTDEHRSGILDVVRACALGAFGWSLFWFFAGSAGVYNLVTAIVSLLIGLILFAVFALRRKTNVSTQESGSFDITCKITLAITFLFTFLALISSLAPPIAKDTLLYHFSVPKNFIAAGNNAVIEGNLASYLALGTEMHVVWSMLLGSLFSMRAAETAASATVFSFFPLLLVAVYTWARELGLEKNWAALASLLIAAIPTAYHVASSGYVDLALALYVMLAVHAVGRWWKDTENEWLFYAALCLGASLSIKLTSLFVFIAVGLVMLLKARAAQNEESEDSKGVLQILLGGGAALICAGILAGPWYLRTWAASGSPIFPFYMNVWKGTAPGWDVERSILFQLLNSRYGGFPKSPIDYLIAPFAVSLQAQPEKPEFFDGVLGVSFLFGIPLIFWAARKYGLKREINAALLVSGCLFVFWLFTSQQLRYLLPIFPGLAVAICFSSALLAKENKTLRQILPILFIAISLVGGSVAVAWFLQKSPLQVVLGGESREEYLARKIDYYPYYQIINKELPENSKVWLINMRRDSYHIDKPYFSDYMFEDYTLKKTVEESGSVAELQSKIRQMGITHILARHDFLLDYRQSTIVEDTRAEKENREKLKITRELILDNKNTIRSDNRFSLVKLP